MLKRLGFLSHAIFCRSQKLSFSHDDDFGYCLGSYYRFVDRMSLSVKRSGPKYYSQQNSDFFLFDWRPLASHYFLYKGDDSFGEILRTDTDKRSPMNWMMVVSLGNVMSFVLLFK